MTSGEIIEREWAKLHKSSHFWMDTFTHYARLGK